VFEYAIVKFRSLALNRIGGEPDNATVVAVLPKRAGLLIDWLLDCRFAVAWGCLSGLGLG